MRNGTTISASFGSTAEAEEFLKDLWLCLARHDLATPRLRVRGGFGLTIELEFDDLRSVAFVRRECRLRPGTQASTSR